MKVLRRIINIAVLVLYPRRWIGRVFNSKLRQLYLRKRVPLPIVQEAGWAPRLVWTNAEYISLPQGFETRAFQPVRVELRHKYI
jgi:hypothetical protein